jgi:peptidoglycan/xylan/chitin deacetylase (PgdA/CDA1 family)
MFQNTTLIPTLPPKQLSLTFDDGPGANTIAIAEFLRDQGIRATFFVVGKHIVKHPDVATRVKSLGHHIGNHTNTHPILFTLTKQQKIEELVAADRLIEHVVANELFLFRAPYGFWTGKVADDLNSCVELKKYTGPIGWNIDGADWAIADGTSSLDESEKRYLRIINEKRSGVIVLHDSSADPGDMGEQMRCNNRTLELTQRLVTRLRSDDYIFRPLDHIISEELNRGRTEKGS